MTQRNEPWQSYRKVSTQTASPAHLVLMLYDGAISFLERGLTGFNYSDPLEFNQTINNNVQRAQAILLDMNARLDMGKGGEIAENFRRLYDYFYRRLQEANLKKKKPPIEEVIGHLRELRESWAEMLRRGEGSDGELASAPAGAEFRLN
ncbi:MAG: flagellar export chaperone FliS [Verrucomicrobiota bacterium]